MYNSHTWKNCFAALGSCFFAFAALFFKPLFPDFSPLFSFDVEGLTVFWLYRTVFGFAALFLVSAALFSRDPGSQGSQAFSMYG